MTSETRQLLARWQALEKGDGLQRVVSMVRALRIVALALGLLVVLGVVYKLHPAGIAVCAGVLGWVTAERNSLLTRQAQWPIVKRYIDWKRVQEDLAEETNAGNH
jgi:hypothetical protein